MATLEAMASGLPVIVSRHAGVTELLTDEQDSFILVEPKDHEEISAKLERLWRDRSLRDYLAQNARHTAEAHPWERTVKETIKVYEQLVY
jgi:glycosyltransferase involved in cell wall biosynthesis